MSADLVFSLLLVVRNEMGYIRRVLESILHQDFPQQQYEIIVVDGYSTDRTPAIVQTYQTRYPGRIQYIKNPQQTLPSGWNIGIRHAKGDYVIRVDGHSDIPLDFLSKTYEVIQRVPEADCVGGVIQTEGEGFWGEVNAYVYSHPFGVGNSKFRITKNRWEGYVDTVPYGAYRRELFQEIGLFDESLKRNEDLEMHARIRNNGGRFFLSTEIRSTYFVRNTLGALLKKSFGDGKWTMVASRRGTGGFALAAQNAAFGFPHRLLASGWIVFQSGECRHLAGPGFSLRLPPHRLVGRAGHEKRGALFCSVYARVLPAPLQPRHRFGCQFGEQGLLEEKKGL